MTHQVAVRLSTFSCINAGHGEPVWGVVPQKLVTESETAPVSTIMSLARGTSYTTVTYMQIA